MREKLVVLGAGESGTGAAMLAKKNNLDVFVSDSGSISEATKTLFLNNQINFEEKSHSLEKIAQASEIVKSPGIAEDKMIKDLRSKNISIISEVEFASRYTKAKIIGITGSNGKTTTTLLLGSILKKAGLDVIIAGNIGLSLSRAICQRDYKFIVLELSSFQLDDIKKFKPDIGILLNITPDHLDRYDNSFKKYAESKFKLTTNQTSKDILIYNQDDPVVNSIQTNAKKIPISLTYNLNEGGYYNHNQINIKLNNKIMTIKELALQGKHNIFNSMAAAISARVFEVKDTIIRQSLIDFQNVEHRLENVLSVHGINFINDSKATNINASWYALESMKKPIIWIAGGVDKGNDYSLLLDLVEEKVKAIICLGKNNKKIHKTFKSKVSSILDAKDMKEAVELAYSLAKKGEIVLLSPACASFDLFKNFEERGMEFKIQVRKL